MRKSATRLTCTYKLGQNLLSKEKKEKDLGVVKQNNLFSEKHIDRIFDDSFMTLRNIRTDFQFLDKDMMRKMLTSMISPD